MRLSKNGFTFIEMIFVLVVLGIIAKFGVEFLAQAYRNYLYTQITDKLANSSSSAVEFIAKRLQYRIRSSVIVRKGSETGVSKVYRTLEGFDPAKVPDAEDYTVLEWIGYDIDSFRGDENATPLWSGIFDKKRSLDDNTTLFTPGSDLDEVNATIQALSYGDSSIDNAALYFRDAESDINKSFGWYGGEAIMTQHLDYAMHPIKQTSSTSFGPKVGDLGDLLEDFRQKGKFDARYYLCWSAYAVSLEGDTLKLYYDYQPWDGEKYSDGKEATIMEHVNTFKMIQKQGVVKIQVCTTNDMNGSGTMNIGGFALCKEKTIY